MKRLVSLAVLLALLLAGCSGKTDGIFAVSIGKDSFYYKMPVKDLPEEYSLEGSGSMRRCGAFSAVIRDDEIVLMNIKLEGGRSAEIQNPLNMKETISIDSSMDVGSIENVLGSSRGDYAGSGEISYCYFYADGEFTEAEKPMREYSGDDAESCLALTFKYGGDGKITNVILADRQAAVYFE